MSWDRDHNKRWEEEREAQKKLRYKEKFWLETELEEDNDSSIHNRNTHPGHPGNITKPAADAYKPLSQTRHEKQKPI